MAAQSTYAELQQRIAELEQAQAACRETDASLQACNERFQLAMDICQEGVWDWDIATGAVYYSPSYATMLGYGPQELPARVDVWEGLLHPEDSDATVQANRDCIENRCQEFSVEFRMRTKQGQWLWILGRGRAVSRDAGGRALRMVGTHTDISERKRMEEALEKRIIALTRPVSHDTSVAIDELFDLEALQRFQDEFAAATNVASLIIYPDGTPVTRPSDFTRLCNDIIRKTEKGCANCRKSDVLLGAPHPEGPIVQPCLSGGLWDAGASITLGGRHIASWLVGQVRDMEQSEECIRAYAREIGADEQKCVDAFYEVPAISREQFQKIARALFTLANQLSSMAYQNVQQARFITERQRAEAEQEKLQAQLTQAKKMESVGMLAGGLAHDFNNLLHAINGNLDLLARNKPKTHPDQQRLATIQSSIERAERLVQQMLLFSRKADSRKQKADINQVVRESIRMLQSSIPKMIEIELSLSQDVPLMYADTVQVEQVLLNLGSNAENAMPQGGRLIIETHAVVLDEEFTRMHPGSKGGPHVLLMVSDTGHGMDKETLTHVFEPFFTTKEVGKGTGLGLASVYGIVKSHSGYIQCYSEKGQGTTFRIYWPVDYGPEDEPARESRTDLPSEIEGTETVLVVDDEEAILDMTVEILEMHGYTVWTARSGEQALSVYGEHGQAVDLIILDLNMPGMGGAQCLKRLQQYQPPARVLLASGYSAHGPAREVARNAAGFIGKPYQLTELLAKIRAVLESDMQEYAGGESLDSR